MKAVGITLINLTALASYWCLLFAEGATDQDHVVTDISKYPYMAMIKINNTLNCSGAIINDRHILTAAHCVNISGVVNLKQLEVLVGGLNSTANTTKSFKVEKSYVHMNFSDTTFDNDIAILKVIGNLKDVKGTKSIPLMDRASEPFTNCTLAGYFMENNMPLNNVTSIERLYSANEDIKSANVCKSELESTKFYTANKYCGHGDYPICHGGGPLVCNNTLVGIASLPGPCAGILHSELFTKVSTYGVWINQTLVKSGVSKILPSLFLMGVSFTAYHLSSN